MKNRICMYSTPFEDITTYHQMIDLSAEMGIGGVEVMSGRELSTLDPAVARDLRAHADDLGIKIPCFSVFADLVGEKAEAIEEHLKKCAELCVILGSPYLHHTVIPYFGNPEAIYANGQAYFEKGVAAVQRITDYAASLGVKTVYEDQGYIFNGVEGFGKMLNAVKRDVGVVMDMGNVFQVDEGPETFIDAFADRIVHAHIKDVQYREEAPCPQGWIPCAHGGGFSCVAPGEGQVDVAGCIEKLNNIGYKGWYGMEFRVASNRKEDLAAYIDQIAGWMEKGIANG